ncbi:MAG TPA: serine hydrolase domain-containing protein [Kineosporiaceae bacterium]
MTALAAIDTWEVPHPGVRVVTEGGGGAARGLTDVRLRVASVSKLLSTYALLVAVEEGAVELDAPAGPPGATLRHLLAHTAGYGFESDAPVLAAPGTRRIYSNRGIEEAARHLERAAGMPFAGYLAEAVLVPLGMTATDPEGSPAFGLHSTVDDLARFAAEVLAPRLIAPETLAEALSVQFPGLPGVVPGVGRFDPCDWGLGFELTFGRRGHWAGTSLSPGTGGHFGGSGSFLWVDRVHRLAAVCLTGRDFGAWALDAWPPLCDAIVAAFGAHVPGAT